MLSYCCELMVRAGVAVVVVVVVVATLISPNNPPWHSRLGVNPRILIKRLERILLFLG
jgi:hypothetical protein